MPILEDVRAALAGRYSLERELGRGGMAVVFLGEDLKHRRPVAVKVLRPEVAGALGPDRFLREIDIAARLAHPHILPLFDSGAAGALLYYVTPFIEGESLRERLNRERQLPVDDAIAIARQLAAALSFAHSRGVVHRDIKPENILLQGGDVLVADFGIARALTAAGGEKLTETGIAVGTPAYMSPEQALADRALDGRSDIYSLGCVLYEMLAGQPPYTGATAQAVMARRLTDPVPSLRAVREAVPAAVEQAIGKALARAPADRFATATQFAAALTPAPELAPVERLPRQWRIWGAAVAVVGVVVALVVSRSTTDAPADSNLLAVAPFDARGPDLRDWGEGVTEYLSRSLDAAGSLRTVSPSVFVRTWSGRADAASARALGRRTGAGLVVFGSLLQGAGDTVRLRATLLDIGDGTGTDVDVAGDIAGMDRLVDSLALRLLRELGRTRPVGAVRNAPFGAASLPAIKAFLQGERLYRRSEYDSALVYHERAAVIDTDFALAHRRIALGLGWRPDASASSSNATAAAHAFKAAALNHGLGPRDSLLIVADSLSFARFADGVPSSRLVDLGERLVATIAEMTRRFPDDPEVWQALGEAGMHSDELAPPDNILGAFDRALALDSGFTPAYEHVLQQALIAGEEARARRYAAAYLTRRGGATPDRATDPAMIELAAMLLTTRDLGGAGISQLIDTIGVAPLWRAGGEHLGWWVDSAETAIRLFRALPRGRRNVLWSPPWVADTQMWPQYLARSLANRGHLAEAYEVFRPIMSQRRTQWWAGFASPLTELALAGGVPADSVAAFIARSDAASASPRWLAWWFNRRDAAALSRAAEYQGRLARTVRDSVDARLARANQSAAMGYLALLRGDSLAAISQLESLPDSLCRFVTCGYAREKLKLAELLAAQGEDQRAAAILDRWMWSLTGSSAVLARLLRARLAARAGEPDLASRYFAFVADAWRHADPELQPYATEAREALRRLVEEPLHRE